MRSQILLTLGLVWRTFAVPLSSSSNPQTIHPKAIVDGTSSPEHAEAVWTFGLSPETPIAVLDYGTEVAGYPFFQVSHYTGKVQIEVKYTEDFSDLSLPYSDGPFPYAVGLTNTYRVQTFEVTHTGQLESFLAQGGQRWQSIRLLSNGTVTFSSVGFVPTVPRVDLDNLPGHFTSSNEQLNEIWKLGARAASVACIPAGAYKPIWEVSSDGAFVRGSRAGITAKANAFEDYTLTFKTKINRGGAGWSVAFPVAANGGGIILNLAGDYPAASTFPNVNRTLLPPSTVVLAYGYDLVNATTLDSYYLDNFAAPFDVEEGTWYTVKTSLYSGNGLAVSIEGKLVFNISLDSYYTATSGSITTGSFGFGGYQDQSAYFKDAIVTASNGTTIYSNDLTDSSTVLSEYGVNTNKLSVCLDGAKRDRLVWLGDFFHTVGILETSTSRSDYAVGTLQDFIDWQIPTGQLPLAVPLGYPSSYTTQFATAGPAGLFFALADYHILGLLAFSSYMQYSNDIAFAKQNWASWKLAVTWLTNQISNSSGIVDLSAEFVAFLGPVDGLAVNTASVEAFKGLSIIASAVGDSISAASWAATADSLTSNIRSTFWNFEIGVYADSQGNSSAFSVAGISFAITSGIATPGQALSSIDALQKLNLSPGYKDSTSVNASASVNISPNTNGFLLRALMQSNKTSETKYLLDNLWTAMISNTTTDTGASWEYVNTELQPGLGGYTSLSHPWGGAPTYILTEYIAGIRPVTMGYKTWVVEPAFAGFNLTSASAKVQTPFGVLSASWEVAGGEIEVVIKSPVGTNGTLVLNRAYDDSSEPNTVVEIEGGSTKTFSYKL